MGLSLLLSNSSLRAASFIVTIYGDVVEPRGGAIWIGNLIEVCATVGISQTLVRTAVSRLVGAGQLVGEREGRRSYYRLTAAAQADFAAAAKLLFNPIEKTQWQFVYLGGQSVEDDIRLLEHAGYTRLGPRFMIGVRPHPCLSKGSIVFSSQAAGPGASFRTLASEQWDLPKYALAYNELLARFENFSAALNKGEKLTNIEHLAARLLLVHHYRTIVLPDPQLPAEALPNDWPHAKVRRLFASLYLRLSPKADDFVSRTFLSETGALPEQTAATLSRLHHLKSAP